MQEFLDAGFTTVLSAGDAPEAILETTAATAAGRAQRSAAVCGRPRPTHPARYRTR